MQSATQFETGPAIHDRFGHRPVPDWYHPFGTKMQIQAVDVERRSLRLCSSSKVARLSIAPVKITDRDWRWRVRWYVEHSQTESVAGSLAWSAANLQDAFALGTHLLYTGHAGRYIREGGYLNVPGPNTPHTARLNISVEITTGMQEAVRAIMRLKS